MVTVNAFRVILLHVPLMVEFYLREAMPCFIQRNNIFNSLIFRLNSGMALLALHRAVLLLVAVLAERVKNYHL